MFVSKKKYNELYNECMHYKSDFKYKSRQYESLKKEKDALISEFVKLKNKKIKIRQLIDGTFDEEVELKTRAFSKLVKLLGKLHDQLTGAGDEFATFFTYEEVERVNSKYVDKYNSIGFYAGEVKVEISVPLSHWGSAFVYINGNEMSLSAEEREVVHNTFEDIYNLMHISKEKIKDSKILDCLDSALDFYKEERA